jgi:putative membrane protein
VPPAPPDVRPPSPLAKPLFAVTLALLVVSGIHPFDGPTWWLEIGPILFLIPVLVATHRRFPLTSLACVLLSIHAVILMVGGHWTYAKVPVGDWVRDTFHLDRNPYDKLGHFAQGFVPAILLRELLLRTSPLRPGGWLFSLTTGFCLGISAVYELIEWLTAVLFGSGAEAFLGTQGDEWDTQSDMLFALIGAVVAQLVLRRLHDRQLAGLARRAA